MVLRTVVIVKSRAPERVKCFDPVFSYDRHSIRESLCWRFHMRYVDEFRDPELITRASDEIHRLADTGKHYRIMEVCGGHTHAIYRFGLKDVLPSNIELIHGPGCPVCVLPMGRIDDGLAVARDADVTFAAFGDMMRVPGSTRKSPRTQSPGNRCAHRLFSGGRSPDCEKEP